MPVALVLEMVHVALHWWVQKQQLSNRWDGCLWLKSRPEMETNKL